MNPIGNPTGRIHSLESFGTHEGPGIRYVIFMQGCRARCRYCHNPDSWRTQAGRPIAAADLFEKIQKCVPYFESSGGGVTASGGEPLLQSEFLSGLFELCRTAGIHTAIDTAGFIAPKKLDALAPLIELTDLFLVDIKWADPERHKELTGRSLDEPLSLIERLENLQKPYWVRNVLVPGLNDSESDLLSLKKILTPLKHCQKFEFLPYHNLGVHKWEELGKKYSLNGHPAASEQDLKRALGIIRLDQ